MGLPNLYFHPPLPKTQMDQALAAADACVAILKPIPLYATVYPNKVFDYMAAGRAVVLAIDGVIRDVVQQAGCGVFASPGDSEALAQAVGCLADNRDLVRLMGRRGREYVEEHFNREKLADSLVMIMEELGQ